MSIRNFWIFTIKLFGLFLFVQGIISFAQYIPTMYLLFELSDDYSLSGLFSIILSLSLYFFIIFKYLIQNPLIVIDRFRLDQGFEDEKIVMNLRMATVFRFGVVVTGGVLLVVELPITLKSFFDVLRSEFMLRENPNTSMFLFHVVSTGLGIWMVLNNKFVSELLLKYTENEEPPIEEEGDMADTSQQE